LKRLGLILTASFLFVTVFYTPASADRENLIAEPETVGLSSERLANIDRIMSRYIEENKLAGGVVLIARKGKIAYFKAFGRSDLEKPMKTDTLFRIASMTKPVTSVAVMQLYEQGYILLTDPISKYIPEFKNPKVLIMLPEGSDPPYKLIPAKREITIRDLLNHTSGLTYRFLADWFPDPLHIQMAKFYEEAGVSDGLDEPEGTVGETVRRLAKLPLASHPGEVWEYSNSGDVLGYLVEIVTGMTLRDYMHAHIFKPVGMDNTYFYPPASEQPEISALWTTDWKGRLEKVTGPTSMGFLRFSPNYPEGGTYFSGGSGLLSTAYDYFRFCQMLLNKGEINGNRLLSRKTVELMTATNHIGGLDSYLIHGKGWKFGLGFSIQMNRNHEIDSGSPGVFEWAGLHSTRFSVDPMEEKITIFLHQHEPFFHHVPVWERLLVISASAVTD
jgi:CubicO group peptidase (beta-lactamase class C family)